MYVYQHICSIYSIYCIPQRGFLLDLFVSSLWLLVNFAVNETQMVKIKTVYSRATREREGRIYFVCKHFWDSLCDCANCATIERRMGAAKVLAQLRQMNR